MSSSTMASMAFFFTAFFYFWGDLQSPTADPQLFYYVLLWERDVFSPGWYVQLPPVSSLKAALRETGHCNGHQHGLEEKVPHHPHQEELISSLNNCWVVWTPLKNLPNHQSEKNIVYFGWCRLCGRTNTHTTCGKQLEKPQLTKHWTRSSFSICSWVSPVHSKKSGWIALQARQQLAITRCNLVNGVVSY